MESSLRKLQKIEADILQVVSKICDEEQIRYYLSSGTLLGAVRHQGFIPWDDDIDIMIPRPDYERFLRVASEKLPPKKASSMVSRPRPVRVGRYVSIVFLTSSGLTSLLRAVIAF